MSGSIGKKIEGHLGTKRAHNTQSAAARELLAAAYDAHATRLYRLALMILADPASAEDAVHQAFMKLAGLGERVMQLDSQEGYLRTAVRNECYRILSAGRHRQAVHRPLGAILEPVDTALAREDERMAIESALHALPPEQREVVYLKIYEGMTFQQIAGLLGLPLNTAASRYRYAMGKLRDLLAGFSRNEA